VRNKEVLGPSLKVARRGRGLLWLWCGILVLLGVLGLGLWRFYLPFRRASHAVKIIVDGKSNPVDQVKALGGADEAARCLELYLRVPKKYAPHRSAAITLLKFCASPKMIVIARRLLRHDEAAVRATAAGLLPNVPEAVPVLITAMKDPDEHVRYCVDSSLRSRGKTAVSQITPLLADGDPDIRGRAALILEGIHVEHPGEPWTSALAALKRLRADPDKTVRYRARQAAAELEALIGLELEVCARLVESELGSRDSLSERELEGFGGAKLVALRLSGYLGLPNGTAPGRIKAVRVLSCCGPAAVDGLVAALKLNEAPLRAEAVRSLAKIAGGRAEAALVAAQKHDDPKVRQEAEKALRERASKRK
jgi:HEAT repeat protein